MFVYDFTLVEGPFDRARRRLVADGCRWLTSFAAPAYEVALADSAGDPSGSEVEMLVGSVRDRGDGVSVPITWTADGPRVLFSALDADLQLAHFTRARTHLSLAGYCTPTAGHAAGWNERQRLHRLTEVSVRSFLGSVGRSLGDDAAATGLGGRQPDLAHRP